MLTNLIAFDLKNSARLLVPLHIALLIFTILGRITLGSDFLMQMPDENTITWRKLACAVDSR